MAKGSIAKEYITQKLLETFEGSFLYNGGKELRIPYLEEGNEVQIKVTLTCAKENVDNPTGGASPITDAPAQMNQIDSASNVDLSEPTEEEKQRVSELLSRLGF